MIPLNLFSAAEAKLAHLANLWNFAESIPSAYESLFTSNPHGLATLIGQNTTYHDWQEFLSDSRVQDYIDHIIYTQAGIIINQYMKEGTKVGVADATKLNSAIKYRDDHKQSYAPAVQYIYISVPLTADEEEFLPNVPENKKVGI